MPTEAEYEAKLATARAEWRKHQARIVAAEAEANRLRALVNWVRAAVLGDAPPECGYDNLMPLVDELVTIASGKATDHVRRLGILIEIDRLYPPPRYGQVAEGKFEDWVRVLSEVRTELKESGVV